MPAILSIVLMIIFHESFLDFNLASQFFDKDYGWFLRDNFLLEKVFHKGGVKLIIVFFLALIGGLIYFMKKKEIKKQKLIIFTLFSSFLTIVLVHLLKQISTLPCPWNGEHFNETVTHTPLWFAFSGKFSRAHCFPAGHSSGGYAFLSLFYAYLYVYQKKNYFLLIPGVFLGLLFGFSQQMRGAHYMSHDFATIFITLLSVWVTTLIFDYYNGRYEV